MKLRLSEAAKADIRRISHFSAERWGAARATAYIHDLRDRMKALARGDVSGVAADDVGPGLRRQISGSHVIWFRVDGDALKVIRVLHQSRDAGRWVQGE